MPGLVGHSVITVSLEAETESLFRLQSQLKTSPCKTKSKNTGLGLTGTALAYPAQDLVSSSEVEPWYGQVGVGATLDGQDEGKVATRPPLSAAGTDGLISREAASEEWKNMLAGLRAQVGALR